ncbi:hypothetical protein AK812_SmicGene24757 [Symbiodinium microadriaticum]|uniref:Uncharacterized protein n=1 Tax=Symbiodinium microadriaticum TaxID=2951 RepID=A0A1Q9DDY0_SYMMI|nr:hypothetical protein AK812_SmicGene24757 [Symbiodinium microadriaticum]
MSQHSNVGRVPHGLPRILLRDGSWSDASSVPGRRAGDHYEAFVRERLTGSYEKQDAARFVADLGGEQCRMLNELWTQAMTISEESTERLWDLLKPDERQAVAGRHSAVADIITEAEVNVKELLGSKAEVLLGPVQPHSSPTIQYSEWLPKMLLPSVYPVKSMSGDVGIIVL